MGQARCAAREPSCPSRPRPEPCLCSYRIIETCPCKGLPWVAHAFAFRGGNISAGSGDPECLNRQTSPCTDRVRYGPATHMMFRAELGVASQPCRACSEYFNYGPPRGFKETCEGEQNQGRVQRSLSRASWRCWLAAAAAASIDIGSGQGVDPGTVDFPIAYVKHYLRCADPAGSGRPEQSRPHAPRGARRRPVHAHQRLAHPRPRSTSPARITADGPYDIKDVNVSPDGTQAHLRDARPHRR